jgi:hypothetical protein
MGVVDIQYDGFADEVDRLILEGNSLLPVEFSDVARLNLTPLTGIPGGKKFFLLQYEIVKLSSGSFSAETNRWTQR